MKGHPVRARGSKARGQVLVEFTFVIPLFASAFLGIAEGGYYIAATTIVNSATHEGARLGVIETTPDRAAIRSRVRHTAAPIVALPDGAITLRIAKANGDGTWQDLVACDDACYQARQKDDRLVVDTAYTHTPLVGYILPVGIPAGATAELTVEGDPI